MNIFSYTDHKLLIHDLYHEFRRASPAFSFRSIAKKLGMNSSSNFAHIMSGRIKIKDSLAEKLANVFELKNEEAQYFKLLIYYNQAKNQGEKRHWLEELHYFLGLHVKITEPRQFAFYQEWYFSAIWALLGYYRFNGDYRELANLLIPSISFRQAKQAISLLVDLDLIRVNESGQYVHTNRIITTGDEQVSVSITTFHLKTLTLAMEAVDRFERKDREISTLTLALSKETLEIARQELRQYRSRILNLVKNDSKADRVYQFNFQIFPLTNVRKSSNEQEKNPQ